MGSFAEFLASKILKNIFGRLCSIKNVLGIDQIPPASEQSFKGTADLKRELVTGIEMESVPLMEPSSLADDIHVKIQETSQNTDLYVRELLEIDKVLFSIRDELVYDTSKLTKIDSKRLKDVGDDPTYSEE